MAKLCIYCGRPLAKDDARFCNDCGRPQVAPLGTNVGAAAPSAIKVKLPPKEYMRDDDPASAQAATSVPGSVISATPVSSSPREQITPPASRLPKRPTRLAPQTPAVTANKAQPVLEPAPQVVRPTEPEPESKPTPAEEASTMVLPNWREELAQLRKEQEQARADAVISPEKKSERMSTEPPPLPRRSPGTPFAPGKGESDGLPQAPARSPSRSSSVESLTQVPETPQPRDNVRSVEASRKTPNTPLPLREGARPTEPAPNPPFAPSESARSADASRRELHVKVWEQETTTRSSQGKKAEIGPAPAVEQNPFAAVDFGAESSVAEDEKLASVTWQTPLSPLPADQNEVVVKETKRPSVPEKESQPFKEAKQPAVKEESRPPYQEEKHSSTDESSPQGTKGDKQDIEDLPTVPLAVPEKTRQEPASKQESSIKIERASTPAPKKWSAPRPEDIEDLPTRPMPASPGASAASRPAQTPSALSGGPRPDIGQMKPAATSSQRNASLSPVPGALDALSAAQSTNRIGETIPDPSAARAQPAGPAASPGARFDPASLPPLPAGPPPASGGSRPRPDAQGPAGAPPRPPAAESAPVSKSAPADTQKPAGASAGEAKKPRKKKHTGRLIVIIVLLVVLVGAGVGAVFEKDWLLQYFQTPAQNQPYLTYQNSSLGFSLEHTQDWNVNVDQAHSAIYFADSSHTGQVNLTVAPASGQVGDYLNQQAIHLGIIAPKADSAATIGGESWQALQGTVTQSGATYMAVLYVTQHSGRFYTLEFLAPQVNFKSIDQSNFIHMRSSFRFL